MGGVEMEPRRGVRWRRWTRTGNEAKEKIADAAISWREAMLNGQYDRAHNHLSTLLLMIDDYTGRTPEPDEDPHTVGGAVPGLD
jgi:hypothetical protein